MNTLKEDIERSANAVASIIGSVDAAAKVVAEACRRHPGFISELHKRLKAQVSIGYLRRLERCGNGELHPALCLCIGPGQPWVEKLSVADQARVVDGIAWPDGDSHRMRPLSELDYHEAKAAFLGGVIADTETITRRIKAHEATRALEAQEYQRQRADRAAADAAAVRSVESSGIFHDSGYVVVTRKARIKAEHFAEWLYSKGY